MGYTGTGFRALSHPPHMIDCSAVPPGPGSEIPGRKRRSRNTRLRLTSWQGWAEWPNSKN